MFVESYTADYLTAEVPTWKYIPLDEELEVLQREFGTGWTTLSLQSVASGTMVDVVCRLPQTLDWNLDIPTDLIPEHVRLGAIIFLSSILGLCLVGFMLAKWFKDRKESVSSAFNFILQKAQNHPTKDRIIECRIPPAI